VFDKIELSRDDGLVIVIARPSAGMNAAVLVEKSKGIVGYGRVPVRFVGIEPHPVAWADEYIPDK
jgi:hypothetical protein